MSDDTGLVRYVHEGEIVEDEDLVGTVRMRMNPRAHAHWTTAAGR